MKDLQALPPVVTYELKEGDTWARAWVFYEDDGETKLDLTGASVEFSAVKKPGDATPILSFIDQNGKAWVDEAESTIRVHLSRSDTRALAAASDRPIFEVTLTRTDGSTVTVRDGVFAIRPEAYEED